jgi:hypothetical protein
MLITTIQMYHGRESSTPKVPSVQGCPFPQFQMYHGQHLTFCRGVNGARQQATALEAEGVQVTRGSLGEYTIDFKTYGWFPDRLPSDLSEDDEEEEDEE